MASTESYKHTVDEVISKSCSWMMSLCMTIRMVLKATRVEEAEVGENSSNCDEAQNEESCRRKRKKKEAESATCSKRRGGGRTTTYTIVGIQSTYIA